MITVGDVTKVWDALDVAITPRVRRCDECGLPVEQPDADLCRACEALVLAGELGHEHVCPECRGPWRHLPFDCPLGEVTRCPGCDGRRGGGAA